MRTLYIHLSVQFLVSIFGGVQSTFTVQPVSVIQAEGLEAVFECLHPGDGVIHNLIANGTPVDVDVPIGNSPAVFIIPAIHEHNNTVVQCRALVNMGGALYFVLSDSVTLTVQGPLESVSQLEISNVVSSILISWMPPFSLNLTTAEPDIVFGVDIYNVTGGETELVETKCNITDISYLFSPDDPSPDHLFQFTVTPASNVEGSLNGTNSQSVLGSVIRVTFHTNSDLDPLTFSVNINALSKFGQQTTCYTVDLLSADDGAHLNCSCSTNHTTLDNTIVLTLQCDSSCAVERHHIYNASITTLNIAGSSRYLTGLEISTHNVYMLEVMRPLQGGIDVSCFHLDGTTSRGFLTVIYSSSNNSNIIYRVALRNGLEPVTNLFVTEMVLQGREWQVAVYDINEGNGLPEERPAVTPQLTSLINTEYQINSDTTEPFTLLPSPPKVTIPSKGVICISCSFSDPLTTGCVGVIHATGLDNLTLTILTVHRDDYSSGLSDNSRCVSIQGQGSYSVTVFGQQAGSLEITPAYIESVHIGTAYTNVSHSTIESIGDSLEPTAIENVLSQTTIGIIGGTGLGVLIVVLMVGILAVGIFVRRAKNRSLDLNQDRLQTQGTTVTTLDSSVDWIDQHNPAYSLVLKKNESYEKPTIRRERNQHMFDMQLPETSDTPPSHYMNIVETNTGEDRLYEEIPPLESVPEPVYATIQD